MGASHNDELPAGVSRETLGNLLYAKPRQSLVSEAEWVGLVRRVAARDQPALHALYERAHRLVFTLAVRITANPETAEEVTLDVFHDVWRRAWSYDAANGTVLGWIMNQARSRAVDRLRFEHRKKRVDPLQGNPEGAGEAPDPGDVLHSKQQARILRAAMAVLTADERQVIESAFFSGLTHAECAAGLQEPLGTVKTRIRSALHKLRRAMDANAASP